MTPFRPVTIATVAMLVFASGALAQRVELRGRGDVDTDIFLRRLIDSGAYVLITRDTLLSHSDTIPGTALVAGSTVRIDGVITGDLVIVDANVFLRPGARVLGAVRNIAGGLYASELATVQHGTHSRPNAAYVVRELEDGTVVLQGLTHRSVLVTDGLFGLRAPTYDRVDGLSVGLGAGYLLPRLGRVEPVLRGRVEYRSQRGVLTGGAGLELERGRSTVAAGVERTTMTNERWIQSDWVNTATYLLAANDRRDYYEADRGFVELQRVLEEGPRTTTALLRGQVEDARTLHAGTPWTLFGTPREDNIEVADGRIASVTAAAVMEWRLPLHVIRVHGSVEAAGGVLDGEHSFNAYVADMKWAMSTFRDHTLSLRGHAQGPLPGTRSLPPQRWSFVGGTGTLPTFGIAEFRGDRVALLETRYSVPTPLRVRFAGAPDVELLHIVGMAWTADDTQSLEQNVGAGLRFSLLSVRAIVDPARAGRVILSLGLELPRPRYPWLPDS
jgi:hypothetical protein